MVTFNSNGISFTIASVLPAQDPVEEILTGVIDGVNKIFTTANNFKAGSTKVFKNGLKQVLGVHYTETDTNEITFVDAPDAIGFEDILIINYKRG